MNNLAGCVAAIEKFPCIAFSFEFLDSAIFEHHSPTPKSDKPAVNGLVYSGFLATSDGLALTKAFMQIKDAKLRRSIVNLVDEIAG